MHPILREKRRLVAYLLAWVPIGGLLAALMSARGGLAESVLLALPMAVVFAFISLAAWYPCRALPVASTGWGRLAGSHAAAAVLSTGIWLLAGSGLAVGLERLAGFEDALDRYAGQAALLFPIGVLLFFLAVAVHYLFAMFESSLEVERRAHEMSVFARDAELRGLRAQINPHFLFNSLNSISSMAGRDADKARSMCSALAGLLRRSLSLGGRPSIPLGEELSMALDYLEVERARFGDRLGVDAAIDESTRSLPVPPLLLQPIVENAVTHGISHLVEGGVIRFETALSGGSLRIEVANPCDPERPGGRGEGLGLANVRRRLEAIYCGEAGLRVEQTPERFRAIITLPARASEEAPL